jgi:hypothetical protein
LKPQHFGKATLCFHSLVGQEPRLFGSLREIVNVAFADLTVYGIDREQFSFYYNVSQWDDWPLSQNPANQMRTPFVSFSALSIIND